MLFLSVRPNLFLVQYLGGSAQIMHVGCGTLPDGRHDLAALERIPGVLPFEVYAGSPATDLMV